MHSAGEDEAHRWVAHSTNLWELQWVKPARMHKYSLLMLAASVLLKL